MADLINREAAIELFRGKCVAKYPANCFMGLFAAATEITSLPAVDAVPVVRCKDCARRNDPGECPMCFLDEGNFSDYTNDDGYCDRGERRGENAAD